MRNLLCDVRRVRRDPGSDDALLHVLHIRKRQVFRRGNVAQERRAGSRRDCAADGGSNVVISGSDIRHQRPEQGEFLCGHLLAQLEVVACFPVVDIDDEGVGEDGEHEIGAVFRLEERLHVHRIAGEEELVAAEGSHAHGYVGGEDHLVFSVVEADAVERVGVLKHQHSRIVLGFNVGGIGLTQLFHKAYEPVVGIGERHRQGKEDNEEISFHHIRNLLGFKIKD